MLHFTLNVSSQEDILLATRVTGKDLSQKVNGPTRYGHSGPPPPDHDNFFVVVDESRLIRLNDLPGHSDRQM